MYGKIFDSMYEGTLYGHWEAIVSLQQMLVLCNQDGVIDMTPQAIAARTSIPYDIIAKGIATLSEPDPYSRTPDEEGRRIILLDEHRPWGWRIVNYEKYQQIKNRKEKLEADRNRIAEKRKVNKNRNVAECRNQSQSVADVAPVTLTASASGSVAKTKVAPMALPDWVPADAWAAWLEIRPKVKAPNTPAALKIALKDLDTLRGQGQDPRAVLEQAITKGYRGLFPVRGSHGGASLEERNLAATAGWKPPEVVQ